MSALNSIHRFESPLDCPSSSEVDNIHSAAPLEHAVPRLDLTEATATPLTSSKKAAAPAPSRFTPWLLRLAYPLGRFGLFPAYFGRIDVTGQENLPRTGPVILAPTHRSRWDAFMVPFVAGHHVTRRHLRFMVSADEVTGLQGWFIRRMGGFPINTNRPAIASLRHGVELLEQGEMMVIFPEGNIFRETEVQPLKPGLARLAIQAEMGHPNLGIQIVPIHIHYDQPLVPWRCQVQVKIGTPLSVSQFCTGRTKHDAKTLSTALQSAMVTLANS